MRYRAARHLGRDARLKSVPVQRLIRDINVVIGVLMIVSLALVYWYVWRPLPQVSGTLRLPVAKAAKIVRDELGVPHISAGSLQDAVFLQGYVHAQDRLFQMDALRRLAAGELSEVVGPGALESDQESRKLRMRGIAEQHYATLTVEERKLLGTYARGVNHFIETHAGNLPVEFTLLGYDPRPWSVVDTILAGLQMFRAMTTSWKEEVLKGSMLEKGDAAKVQALFPVRTGGEVQPGSNAWVLSGTWTASGKPILANDTHLEFNFPCPWYQVHLTAPDLNVEGFSLPGVPMVIIGHNERIAWGITNLHYDVQDLYAERINPQTGQYAFNNKVEQARQMREVIRVKGAKPVEWNAWVTRHGPIVLAGGNTQLALRWAAGEPRGFAFPFSQLNHARNWQEFNAAASLFAGPGSNFVYADVDGNIGYHAAGMLPVRRNHEGDVPVPGDEGKFEWDGYIPYADLPSAFNPASGVIVTSNQNPFPADYPFRVNGNFAPPYRAKQIGARLRSRKGWKPTEMLGVQMDVYSAFGQRLAKALVQAWQKRGQKNAALAPAVDVLKNWDGQMRRGLSAPLIITLAFQHLRKAVADRAAPGRGSTYEQPLAPAVLEKLLDTRPKDWFEDFDAVLMKVFSDSVDEGKRLQGDDVKRWDYGKYTEFTLPHPVLGRVPYIGRYFNIGPVPMDGSSTTVKQTTRRLGPSMRFVADLSNWEESLSNLSIGESGQPLSGHFKDQWEAYYSGRSFPMRFGNASLAGRDTLTVEPSR